MDYDASAMTLANGWHHVAMVIPVGADSTADAIVYLDGVSLSKTFTANDDDALTLRCLIHLMP